MLLRLELAIVRVSDASVAAVCLRRGQAHSGHQIGPQVRVDGGGRHQHADAERCCGGGAGSTTMEAMAGKAAQSVRLNVNGHPQAPVTVDVRVAQETPLQVNVQERRLGLPADKLPITPRPEWMAAAPFNDVSDSTIVVHTVTIQ